MMVDTHAHLNIDEYNKDIDTVLKKAKEFQVDKIIVIGMDEKSNLKALELATTYDQLFATIGIHPGYVESLDKTAIEKYLMHPKVVAIGECGLDFYWQDDNKALQKEVFQYHIDLAVKTKLPLVIHTRNSFDEAYQMLLPYKGLVSGVFHCFSSHLEDAKKAIELGFYIGIDGPITFKNQETLETIVKYVDINYMLIETDSPYLSPVPFRGKRNEPAHLLYIAKKIAEMKSITLEEIQEITTKNAYRLFKLGGKEI